MSSKRKDAKESVCHQIQIFGLNQLLEIGNIDSIEMSIHNLTKNNNSICEVGRRTIVQNLPSRSIKNHKTTIAKNEITLKEI